MKDTQKQHNKHKHAAKQQSQSYWTKIIAYYSCLVRGHIISFIRYYNHPRPMLDDSESGNLF